jgi:hypothetical protein
MILTESDAVYHTSIVIQGVEYFFGQGIRMVRAGTTHHGQPMEVVELGKTDIPPEDIQAYLEILKETYTAEV